MSSLENFPKKSPEKKGDEINNEVEEIQQEGDIFFGPLESPEKNEENIKRLKDEINKLMKSKE